MILALQVLRLIESGLGVLFALIVTAVPLLVVLSSFAMYIAIYVNLVRARKNMEAMQSGGNTGNTRER